MVSLVRAAAAARVPVSVDPNLRPSITPDVDLARSFVTDLLPLAGVVKLSDEDAGVLWPGQGVDAVLTELSAAAIAPLVAVTRGGEGAVLAAGRQRAAVAAPPVRVADTIGAGDSFMAALLAGLLTRDLLPASASTAATLHWLGSLAVDAAAVTCSRPGADPPWARELPALSTTPGSAGHARLPAGNLGA